jgi:hypothetical protein
MFTTQGMFRVLSRPAFGVAVSHFTLFKFVFLGFRSGELSRHVPT